MKLNTKTMLWSIIIQSFLFSMILFYLTWVNTKSYYPRYHTSIYHIVISFITQYIIVLIFISFTLGIHYWLKNIIYGTIHANNKNETLRPIIDDMVKMTTLENKSIINKDILYYSFKYIRNNQFIVFIMYIWIVSLGIIYSLFLTDHYEYELSEVLMWIFLCIPLHSICNGILLIIKYKTESKNLNKNKPV